MLVIFNLLGHIGQNCIPGTAYPYRVLLFPVTFSFLPQSSSFFPPFPLFHFHSLLFFIFPSIPSLLFAISDYVIRRCLSLFFLPLPLSLLFPLLFSPFLHFNGG